MGFLKPFIDEANRVAPAPDVTPCMDVPPQKRRECATAVFNTYCAQQTSTGSIGFTKCVEGLERRVDRGEKRVANSVSSLSK